MEGITRNLKFAWRALVAKPSFSLTVVVTLALGIGANTPPSSAFCMRSFFGTCQSRIRSAW